MSETLYDRVNESLNYIKKYTDITPLIGVILGTGWQCFTEELDSSHIIDYKNIPHFSPTSVEGHEGRLVIGKYADLNIICLKGRLHAYEEFTIEEVVHPVRTICSLGVSILIVTNAVGGINLGFSQGDYVLICDHINFMGLNPLTGRHDPRMGARFVDMSEPYDKELIRIAESGLNDLDVNVKKGTYAGVSGPSYETPSEIKMLRLLGADIVGMSTIPEIIVSRQMGVRVCGISCIANMAAGIKEEKISHDNVLAFMKANERKSTYILKEIVHEFSLLLS